MARYYIKTFGCKVNQVESDELHASLQSMGMQSSDNPARCDFIIVNTCTVTGEADKKVRKELRRSARLSNIMGVVVTGCAAKLNEEELESLDEKIYVLTDRSKIPSFFASFSEVLPITDAADLSEDEHMVSSRRVRVPVKIQDGCEDFCSYCIVPFARGTCSSVSPDAIIQRVKSLVEAGTKEIILTGINLGNYTDGNSDSGSSLVRLLRRIQNESSLHRVRLSSIEPRHVCDDLISFLSEEDSILCGHLHIPLQSGSDYVLGDMNRSYSANEYLQLVERLRVAIPDIAISTDLIVAYPSETEEDFEATLDLCSQLRFADAHIFRYSPREGTAAAHLKPLSPKIIRRRAQTLREELEKSSSEYRTSRLGSQMEVIVEQVDEEKGLATGTSREYLRVKIPLDNHRVGDLVSTEL